MHLSLIRSLALFASLVHGQETNSSESATAVSTPVSVSSDTLKDVWTASSVLNTVLPSSSFVSTSMISSDATFSPTVTVGLLSAVDALSGTVQSTTSAMSASMRVASGNPLSIVNATNITTTSAPTPALDKKNIAGQIRGFVGTVGLPFLIGAFVGFVGLMGL